MNVTLNKTDEVNATITVEIVKADYENEVENSLKDLRKNAVIPGFRKGMVPPEFLRQKYGKSIIAEEINKLATKSLSDFVVSKKPELLGEPLPSKSQTPIDFDTQEDFVFTFDIGLSPEINVTLTKNDKLPYYLIQVTGEMIDNQINLFKRQHSMHVPVENVEDKDVVKGRLVELDENNEPKANGIVQDSATLMPLYIKNEEEKTKFIDAELHSTVFFNPNKAYDGNEVELASFFGIKKDKVKNHPGDFSFEINEITRLKEAELDQELFDKVLGFGTVDSEEMFREKIKEMIVRQLAVESDYRFITNVYRFLEEKASGTQLPDDFLKRWFLASDSKRTPESLQEEYPEIVRNTKSYLIREYLIEENDITIDESDFQEYAKRAARSQLAQYGVYNVPDDLLNKYSQELLEKEEILRSFGEKIFEDKLIKILKEQVTLEPREITLEEFNKLVV